jgi:ferredoxin
MPDGGILHPPAKAGERVIDALARFGVPVRIDGGKVDMFSTCRVGFASAWTGQLPPPAADERRILAELGVRDGRTRVLCRLVMTTDLDGLELELPWDALVPQTYWIAG